MANSLPTGQLLRFSDVKVLEFQSSVSAASFFLEEHIDPVLETFRNLWVVPVCSQDRSCSCREQGTVCDWAQAGSVLPSVTAPVPMLRLHMLLTAYKMAFHIYPAILSSEMNPLEPQETKLMRNEIQRSAWERRRPISSKSETGWSNVRGGFSVFRLPWIFDNSLVTGGGSLKPSPGPLSHVVLCTELHLPTADLSTPLLVFPPPHLIIFSFLGP
ncbi:hypothetical protein STEG23_031156 [Scotinomys teguina]